MQILKRLTSVFIVGNRIVRILILQAQIFWIALSLTIDLNKAI